MHLPRILGLLKRQSIIYGKLIYLSLRELVEWRFWWCWTEAVHCCQKWECTREVEEILSSKTENFKLPLIRALFGRVPGSTVGGRREGTKEQCNRCVWHKTAGRCEHSRGGEGTISQRAHTFIILELLFDLGNVCQVWPWQFDLELCSCCGLN